MLEYFYLSVIWHSRAKKKERTIYWLAPFPSPLVTAAKKRGLIRASPGSQGLSADAEVGLRITDKKVFTPYDRIISLSLGTFFKTEYCLHGHTLLFHSEGSFFQYSLY